MMTAILTGVSAYISTSLDYLFILMIVFGTVKREERLAVYFGDLLGTTVLVSVSLLFAYVLRLVPAQWVLGLLGLIPIAIGLRFLLSGDDDDDETIRRRLGLTQSTVINVAIITVATCGADNIGIYVPLFATLDSRSLGVVLVTFVVMLTLVCILGALLGSRPVVARLLDRFGTTVTSLIYMAIGVYILLDSGTIQHLISLV